jgi:hypothetical protein
MLSLIVGDAKYNIFSEYQMHFIGRVAITRKRVSIKGTLFLYLVIAI